MCVLWASLSSLESLTPNPRPPATPLHPPPQEIIAFCKAEVPLALLPGAPVRVSFVCHSLGGLILRRALEDPVLTPLLPKVGLIGPPLASHVVPVDPPLVLMHQPSFSPPPRACQPPYGALLALFLTPTGPLF